MGVTYVKSALETGAFGSGGGAPSDVTEAIHLTDVNYTDNRNPLKEEVTDAYIYARADGGALSVDGSIEGAFRPVAHASFLEALFGYVSTGTYTLDACKPVVLQIGEKLGAVTRARNIYGTGIGKAEFTFATKEYVRVNYEFFGAQGVEATYDTALTYPAETPLVFWRATLALGGTTVASKEATLSIDRALDDSQYVLGSFLRYRLTQTGMTEIGGSITLTEDQIDNVKLVQYGSTGATQVPSNNALGSGSLTYTCLKTDGTAGCVFTVPVTFDSFDFKGSKVSEFGKVINYTSVGNGFQLVVS